MIILMSQIMTSQTATIFNKSGDIVFKDVPNEQIQEKLRTIENPDRIYMAEKWIEATDNESGLLYRCFYTTEIIEPKLIKV